MKNHICFLLALMAGCLSFISCEKEGSSSHDDPLYGTWLRVKEETTMDDGTVHTYTDKTDWYIYGGKALFPYLLTITSDGVSSIENGVLYYAGEQWTIVSHNGKTLVLELADATLEHQNWVIVNTHPGDPLYAKSVATYSRQE